MAPRHTLGSKPPKDGSNSRRRSRSKERARERSLPPNRRPPTPEPPPPSRKPRASSFVGAAVGVAIGAGALGAISWASGWGTKTAPPPGPRVESAPPPEALPPPPVPEPARDDSNAPEVAEPEMPAAPAVDAPYEGPWLGALAQETPIYPTARFSKNRLGYIRRGGKAPVTDKPIKTESCSQGFYPLVDGGYVCGKYATVDLNDERWKAGVKAPDLEGLLPYRYAYNNEHGTPLYIQVPPRDEMLRYEPYLLESKKKKKPTNDETEAETQAADQPRPSVESDAGTASSAAADPPSQFLGDGGLLPPATADSAVAEEPPVPWWQQGTDKPIQVKLSDLQESDGTLAKRMVKGFFIAIDRTFSWNDRMWYRGTDGLIAPADRMIIPKTPELHGMELSGGEKQIGFILWKSASKYEFPDEAKAPKKAGKLERFAAVALTGRTLLHDKQRYRETVDGWWLNESHGTYTDPGPRPSEVGEDEKWIDVNLSRKTLVAFIGDRAVYATLISPGKRSENHDKDHRTKTGKFRIREKHVSTTMDGDGPSGDLPYSIQDVPYVQYYDGSYALHGAFWHQNFGREQSHGCVNLAPADAKHLFFWSEPSLPRGWHGVWASEKRRGTMVVIHE
jgi:lipoprotein-anchoring transpeptidase ErfK/SrfK